jgi:hypothetical protein
MFRLNMQIGNMMQHVAFEKEFEAKDALATLFAKKASGSESMQISQTMVNPQAVNFAFVGKFRA